MKINIGPFSSDIIPVRDWERTYERWRSDSYYLDEEDYTWYDKVIMGFFEKLGDFVRPLNRWSNNRERRIKIRIDNYDVWNADHTLAMIIHPTLVKLKEVQHGACHVDPEDVLEHLRPSDEPDDTNGYVDNTHFDRWNYVLDEMIWAFEQCAKSDKGDDQFHHNSEQLEMISTPLGDNPKLLSIDFNYQKDPTKPKYWVDTEAKKLHYDRISNGLRLFAKYYFSLWD
jgi:hypothetical protein